MNFLICDDDAAMAARMEQLVCSYLRTRGVPAECTVCTRGEEALALPDPDRY